MMKGRKTIDHLAWQNDRQNMSRSVLIMIAILLSTVLLTAIASYGIGLIRWEKESTEERYGRFYGMLNQMDQSQLDAVEGSDVFTETGVISDCGTVKADNSYVSLNYLDIQAQALSCVEKRIVEGSYPEAEDEILLTRGMLKACGCPDGKIGDTITINIRPDMSQPYFEKTFKISGFLSEEKSDGEADSYGGFVSEAFYNTWCRDKEELQSLIFRMDDSIELDYENAEETIEKYAAECGLNSNQVTINSMYILMALNPGNEIQLTCGFLLLIVVIFSMIVIYNIFQISLVQRMQEYGRLKALGMTNRQMRRLISREGLILALPSVPVGALIGYLTALGSFTWLNHRITDLQSVNMNDFNFFSAPAVLGSIVIAFLTVWLAMVRPKRTISKISAIEAIAYREGLRTGNNKKSKKNGLRKGHNTVNEWTLALANISAGKKQAVVTMITMGLSCVMLVVMMNCLGNIDTEYEARKSVEYGQFKISLDYTFYDEVYPENNLDQILQDDPLDQEFVDELKRIEGVTDVITSDSLVIDRQGQMECVSVISRELFEFEKGQGGTIGELDYDKASEENQLIYGWSYFLEDNNISLGDDISYELWNGSERKAYTSPLRGSFGSLSGGWAITEDAYENSGYTKGSSIGTIWIDCNENDRASVEEQVRELMRTRSHLDLETFSHNMEEQAFGTRVIRYGIYSLLAIIGLIGFLNMANTMIISITTRMREYGIMQAVGMTNRQLNRSLVIQGFIYVGGTMLISMAAGIPLGYLAFVKFKKIAGFGMNVYHFPLAELLVLAAVLLLLQLALSWLLSKNIKKDTLVERIKY